MAQQYEIFGYQVSYFTKKVEAAFAFKGIDVVYRPKTLLSKGRIERSGGTHQVPVVKTPSGQYLKDSTLIIEHLDEGSVRPRLFPDDSSGILVRLLEEWLDEWFPQVVLHYRWNYDENADWASHYVSRELAPRFPRFLRQILAKKVAQWGKRAVRALGLDHPFLSDEAEALTRRVCVALETQLKQTRFVLGNRPTAVDAVLLGAFRAHLLADPVCVRQLSEFKHIRNWVETPFVQAEIEQEPADLATLEQLNHFADVILTEMSGSYRTFMSKNRRALEHSEKLVYLSNGQEMMSVLARRGPEISRMRTAGIIRDLSRGRESSVLDFLEQRNLKELFGWAS